ELLIGVAALPRAARIEKRLRQGTELIGIARRQVHADPQLLAIVKVNLRMRDGSLSAAQLRRRLFTQRCQHRLDVLAGAQRVGAKLRTFAGVISDIKPSNADAILPAGRRIGDLIIAEHAIASEVLNAKLSLRGAAAAEINLFLAEHAGLSIIGCLRRYVETFS